VTALAVSGDIAISAALTGAIAVIVHGQLASISAALAIKRRSPIRHQAKAPSRAAAMAVLPWIAKPAAKLIFHWVSKAGSARARRAGCSATPI
jgi:hypothetical protein